MRPGYTDTGSRTEVTCLAALGRANVSGALKSLGTFRVPKSDVGESWQIKNY